MNKILVFTILFLVTLNLYSQNKCFKASPNYIIINSGNFLHPSKQITVECWVKVNSKGDWSSPVSNVTDNYHEESGFAFAFTKEKLRFMLKTRDMRGDEWNYNPGVDVELNQWTHIAGTYDGESIKIFMNGELIESKTTSGEIIWDFTNTILHIGAFKDFNENLIFDGQIDEVRIWSVARTNAEIQESKSQKLFGNERGLVAYYNFDTDNNEVVFDQSKNKIHGKLNIPAQEQVFVPSGAMITPQISKLDVLSPHSFQVDWETSESVLTYDYYMIDLSKSRNFDQLISHQKSLKSTTVIENITGGSNVYLRIKGYSKDIGFTAYSDIKEINNFSTALSIIVNSEAGNSKTTTHKLVDYNILTTNYIGLPSSTKDVQFDFKLNNVSPEKIIPGKIIIRGPSRSYESDFSQSSDVSLFDLKPGKYTIEAQWGAVDLEEPLAISLEMEIKPMFYQQIFFQLLLVVLGIGGLYFLLNKFRIVPATHLKELRNRETTKENRTDWIDPDLLEKKASQIKEYITREKSYLDPKFNLKFLAEQVDIPHYQISKILNDYYGLNFNDFINEFRVNEFVQIINQNKSKHIKNSAIAYQCGFYSESTFFRAFKKFMGKTPQQYLKELLDKGQND